MQRRRWIGDDGRSETAKDLRRCGGDKGLDMMRRRCRDNDGLETTDLRRCRGDNGLEMMRKRCRDDDGDDAETMKKRRQKRCGSTMDDGIFSSLLKVY